jgi:signal transduction histidine kinase
MTSELVWLPLRSEPDVFAARQMAREAAAALGMDGNDQVRVATAVSELGRVIVAAHAYARVVISVASLRSADQLQIAVFADESFVLDEEEMSGTGMSAARRLMDSVRIVQEQPAIVELLKALPSDAKMLRGGELAAVRARLAESVVSSPLDELRAQNLELLAAMEELRGQQEELVRLNVELEETNKGVMAMYAQLSEELEETNRGVVALYAELDERGVQLHRASEAKSRFLANVSHELRGPLNSLLGLVRLLGEPDSEPLTESQTHLVRLLRSAAEELLGLVNDLLDLAKAESGKLDPDPRPIDLESVLADLRATMRPLGRQGVDLLVDVAEDACVIETDGPLLTQVLRNLVANALRFTERGRVLIQAVAIASANLLTITVDDTGIGIAAEHQELVFEEFFQVRGPLQSGSNSTGLGLPYARRVAEALGGSLSLSSQVGRGSTFTLVLPARWSLPPRQPPATATVQSDAEQFATVLVVDDEATFRELLRAMLQGHAARVIEAEDGPSALELMRRARPDVVLLDLRMPGGGGEDVLAHTRTDEDLREIPIVVVTSVALDDVVLRRLSPAVSVLSKSDLTTESLLASMRSAQGTLTS